MGQPVPGKGQGKGNSSRIPAPSLAGLGGAGGHRCPLPRQHRPPREPSEHRARLEFPGKLSWLSSSLISMTIALSPALPHILPLTFNHSPFISQLPHTSPSHSFPKRRGPAIPREAGGPGRRGQTWLRTPGAGREDGNSRRRELGTRHLALCGGRHMEHISSLSVEV